MQQLLIGSRFAAWLELDPWGTQLPPIWAVLCGAKPAADFWIRSDLVPSFMALATNWKLCFHLDPYFDRFDERALRASGSKFGTTRAAIARQPGSTAEAHIFVSTCKETLHAAIAAGWYPLVVDDCVVDKNVADHGRFGRALGYPECCITFFRKRNHWTYDNTPYAAYRNTAEIPNRLSNGLSRHTSFALISHMPCSFACHNSIDLTKPLLAAIRDEAPLYATEILRRLGLPMLSLSEVRLFVFEGRTVHGHRIEYEHVEPLNPTSHEDRILKALQHGDACVLDGNILRIERRGATVASYFARGDQYGPECPFILEAQ